METLHVLPVLAALANGVGFILYNQQSKAGTSTPNPVSWFIWAFLSVINLLSFRAMSDSIAALQFVVGTVGCIGTFFYVLAIGKFARPTPRELVVLIICLVAIVAGLGFGSAETSSLVVALGLFISWEPTISKVIKDPTSEEPLPWMLWTVAFGLTAINAYIYKGGWSVAMVVPVLCVVLDAIPPILYYRSVAANR
jgi:hypothetical protein